MNFKENVTVVIDGDSKPLEMAVAKSNKVLEQSQKNNERIASKGGQSAGDAFGRQFNRAQDRWMNLAENGFRKWGGTVGGIVADVLGAFDKVDKVQQATERFERTAVRGAGSHLASEAGGNAAGVAAGSAIGSYAGSNGIIESLLVKRAKQQFKQAELFTRRGNMEKLAGMGPVTIGDRLNAGMMYARGGVNMIRGKLGGPDLGGISKFFGGSIGLAVAGGIGAIAAVVKGYEKLAQVYDEIVEKQKKFADNKFVIDAIESLGNTTDKTRAILKKFGDDGLEAYRKLQDEQKKLGIELERDEKWKILSTQAKISLDGVKQEFGGLWDNIKYGFAKAFTSLSLGGIDEATAKAIDEGEKNNRIWQKMVDDQAKSKIAAEDQAKKLAEERLKTEKEIEKVQNDVNEAADEAIKRQSEERLKNLQDYQKEIVDIMESLSGKIVQGNPSLSGMTPEAVLTSESKRLYQSTLSPAELALQKSYGMQQLGTSSVRDTLRRSGEMGKLGSFKRQIESANVYDTNKENAKVAVALMDLLIQYKENGNALAVKQKVSR